MLVAVLQVGDGNDWQCLSCRQGAACAAAGCEWCTQHKPHDLQHCTTMEQHWKQTQQDWAAAAAAAGTAGVAPCAPADSDFLDLQPSQPALHGLPPMGALGWGTDLAARAQHWDSLPSDHQSSEPAVDGGSPFRAVLGGAAAVAGAAVDHGSLTQHCQQPATYHC